MSIANRVYAWSAWKWLDDLTAAFFFFGFVITYTFPCLKYSIEIIKHLPLLIFIIQGVEIVNDEQGDVWATRGSKNAIFVKVGITPKFQRACNGYH